MTHCRMRQIFWISTVLSFLRTDDPSWLQLPLNHNHNPQVESLIGFFFKHMRSFRIHVRVYITEFAKNARTVVYSSPPYFNVRDHDDICTRSTGFKCTASTCSSTFRSSRLHQSQTVQRPGAALHMIKLQQGTWRGQPPKHITPIFRRIYVYICESSFRS